MQLTQRYEVSKKVSTDQWSYKFGSYIDDSTDALILTNQMIGNCYIKGDSDWRNEHLERDNAVRIFSELSHQVWVIGQYEIMGNYRVRVFAPQINPNYTHTDFSLTITETGNEKVVTFVHIHLQPPAN